MIDSWIFFIITYLTLLSWFTKLKVEHIILPIGVSGIRDLCEQVRVRFNHIYVTHEMVQWIIRFFKLSKKSSLHILIFMDLLIFKSMYPYQWFSVVNCLYYCQKSRFRGSFFNKKSQIFSQKCSTTRSKIASILKCQKTERYSKSVRGAIFI